MPKIRVSIEGAQVGEFELIKHVELLEARLMELETREREAGGLRAALVTAEAARDKYEAMQVFWRSYAADLDRTLLDVCKRVGWIEEET